MIPVSCEIQTDILCDLGINYGNLLNFFTFVEEDRLSAMFYHWLRSVFTFSYKYLAIIHAMSFFGICPTLPTACCITENKLELMFGIRQNSY